MMALQVNANSETEHIAAGCVLLGLVLRAELAARRALTHRWMDHSGALLERGVPWSFLAEYTFVHYPTQVLGCMCAYSLIGKEVDVFCDTCCASSRIIAGMPAKLHRPTV